ncbi:MAG: universal stress protein [bacterium]|nr:universal stress protein [bacterium]
MSRKIMVPVDLSEDSEIVLERGKFYQQEGDELILCHIVPDPAEFAGFHIPNMSTNLAKKELMDVARKELVEFVEDFAPGTAYRLVMGAPAREIIKVAEEEKVDLIVIGSHRGGAWAHLFVSNASEKVIRDAMCEVVVIPLSIDTEEQLIKRRARRKKDRSGAQS